MAPSYSFPMTSPEVPKALFLPPVEEPSAPRPETSEVSFQDPGEHPRLQEMLLLKKALDAAYPLSVTTFDLPAGTKGEVFLDAELGDGSDFVFQARAGRQDIGLSVIEPGGDGTLGYGSGPDEVLGDVAAVMARVAEIVALG